MRVRNAWAPFHCIATREGVSSFHPVGQEGRDNILPSQLFGLGTASFLELLRGLRSRARAAKLRGHSRPTAVQNYSIGKVRALLTLP